MFPDLTRDDVFRLETARLWLRWPRQADAVAITTLAGEKAVAEMTAAIPHPLSKADATDFVFRSRRGNLEGSQLTMAITPRAAPGTLIGIVGIEPDRTASGPHLGYWLGTPYWGSGLMTEAARAIIDAFFAYSAGAELTSSARLTNPASRRVLEKCGFSVTGSGLKAFPARGAALPVDEFRLERRAWGSFEAWSGASFLARRGEGGAAAQV